MLTKTNITLTQYMWTKQGVFMGTDNSMVLGDNEEFGTYEMVEDELRIVMYKLKIDYLQIKTT